MPTIKMPDGTLVRFPDDMPKDQIAALIQEKFPDAVAKNARTVSTPAQTATHAMGGMFPVPGLQPLADAVGQIVQNEQAPQQGWERATLLPMETNTETGQRRLALPNIVKAPLDAAGRAINNNYPIEVDPKSGKVSPFPDQMVQDATTIGATITPDMAPLPKVPVQAGVAAVPDVVRTSERFGIPLTKGQATGSLSQLTREETLRQVEGSGQRTIQAFDARQHEAIDRAAQNIGRQVGDNAENMPGMVTGAIKDKVAFSRERASSLYQIAEDGGLVVNRKALADLPNLVQQHIADANLIVDSQLTPAASVAVQEINKAGELQGGLRPTAPASVTLKGIEQVRKRLVNLKPTNASDAVALKEVKRAFDNWLDDSISTALISGDENALKALKAARQETQVYKSMTAPRANDAAGLAVKKMQQDGTTAEEVGQWLYGANIANPPLVAPKVALRIKQIVGANSPEFAAVRAAAWERLVRDFRNGDMHSALVAANRIEDFLNAKGTTLASVLYTPAQRQMMQAFANVLRATVTPKGATNPSRTAYTLMRGFTTVMRSMGAAVGYAHGGVPEAVLGALATPIFRNARNLRAASKAVNYQAEKATAPPPTAVRVLPSLTGRGAEIGMSAPPVKENPAALRLAT